MGKYTSNVDLLAKEIATQKENIFVWAGDSMAVAEEREIEKIDYDTKHRDYRESIAALERLGIRYGIAGVEDSCKFPRSCRFCDRRTKDCDGNVWYNTRERGRAVRDSLLSPNEK